MNGYTRPLGPIGSNIVPPLQTARPRGCWSLRRPPLPATPDATLDFKGYFKVETYPHNSVIYRPGDTQRPRVPAQDRPRAPDAAGQEQPALGGLHPSPRGPLRRAVPSRGDDHRGAGGRRRARPRSGPSRDATSAPSSRHGPTLAVDVVRAYAERVRGLRKRVLGLTFKEVPARLADTLLTLAEAHGERCPHGGETDLRAITSRTWPTSSAPRAPSSPP